MITCLTTGGQLPSKSCNAQVEADWPDLYVYRLGGAEPTYDSLSMPEFIAGYLSIMEEVTTVCSMNVNLLRHLTYLRQLMEDCFLTEWHLVRTAHKHVLNGIEHRRFTWNDMSVVIDTKRTALNRLQGSSHAPVQVASSSYQGLDQSLQSPDPQPGTSSVVPAPRGPPVACQLYQNLTCMYTCDHESEGVLLLHCCSFCLSLNGFKHLHPLANCRKAKDGNKPRPSRSNKRTKRE